MDDPAVVDSNDDLGLVTEEIAAEVMATLCAAYPSFEKGMNERRRGLYISRMIGLDAAALLEVVEEWIDEQRFPPSPAELRQPTLQRMRQAELQRFLDEAQAAWRTQLRSDVPPGAQEPLASGLAASVVLTEVKRYFDHTFFGQVRLVRFEPEKRLMVLDHPHPGEWVWWETKLGERITETLQSFAGEPIQVTFDRIVA